MGECNYYLKARFADENDAASAEPRLAQLLAEGEGAYAYWQDSRRRNRRVGSAAKFWTGFRERFPLTFGYLKELGGISDWDDGLAGHLGNLVDPRPDREPRPRASLIQSDDLLLLQLDQIWHFTDMGLLERYCREDLGAIAVGSISEEELYLDEDSDLEEWSRGTDSDPFEAICV